MRTSGKLLHSDAGHDTLMVEHIKPFPCGIIMRPLFCAVLFSVATALPAIAQDNLSVDDLINLWGKQKTVFHEAQSNGLGKTRGLELVTVDDAAPATGASVTETPGVSDPNRPLTGPAETAQTVAFGKLAPELQVNLQINFAFDSATLSEQEQPKMQKVCTAMTRSDVRLFRIVGHTDTAGSDAYNERLSLLRAKEVVRYLVDECGITPQRLEAMGMGKRFLFNTSNPRADENRRVEFQALS